MRLLPLVLVIMTLASVSAAQAASQIRIRDFLGTVEILHSDSVSEITYDLDTGEDLIDAPRLDRDGEILEIDGGGAWERGSCRTESSQVLVKTPGGDFHPISSYPKLTITVPESFALEVQDSMLFGTIADTISADLVLVGCGDLQMGDVEEALNYLSRDAGDTTTGSVGEAYVSIEGSGGLSLGDVAGDLAATIDGSGDIEAGAVAGDVTLAINGSGAVELAEVSAAVEVTINGSGDFEIGGGTAEPFLAEVDGSGSISFDGMAVSPQLRLSGSGDVELKAIRGDADLRSTGSGELVIGGSN